MFSSVKFVVSDMSFFDVKVEVVALSSYEEKEKKFKEEVTPLLSEAIIMSNNPICQHISIL